MKLIEANELENSLKRSRFDFKNLKELSEIKGFLFINQVKKAHKH